LSEWAVDETYKNGDEEDREEKPEELEQEVEKSTLEQRT